ncbi:YerC/YecD family TrpR-related protein [uncultured Maricaulis sp.]|uniref:YerC/YecD family TrpR-related protein n=1 Tax=uncultured Maricaulis sp. TaxID=174710 RepID=UPI0030DB270B|tara:strand:+ start:177855 stop:178175 length:321 start_codon:yes stop_codon:yes gene_type:complete
MSDETPDDRRSTQPDLGPLCSALRAIRTEAEGERFLRDLLTPGEMKTLTERWRVAGLLAEGGHSYREISEMTGASTTTVTRVSRFLTQEPWQGYRLVLNRLKDSPS